MHVHVQCEHGEAKFWIEPIVALAKNKGLSATDIQIVEAIIKEHANEIRTAWHKHFGA